MGGTEGPAAKAVAPRLLRRASSAIHFLYDLQLDS